MEEQICLVNKNHKHKIYLDSSNYLHNQDKQDKQDNQDNQDNNNNNNCNNHNNNHKIKMPYNTVK